MYVVKKQLHIFLFVLLIHWHTTSPHRPKKSTIDTIHVCVSQAYHKQIIAEGDTNAEIK